MASSLYTLERTAESDCPGRCGHCKQTHPLEASRVVGVGFLGWFFFGLSISVPLLRCPACGKGSQRHSRATKWVVAFTWAPMSLLFAVGAVYFFSHASDDPAAIALAGLALAGAAVVATLLWRVLSQPLYPVAGRPIDKDGRHYWGR